MTAEPTLRDSLASEFDDYAVRRRVRSGDRNNVYEVSVDGRRAACKTTDVQPATLAREAAVLAAVADRTSVPVPDVIAAGDGSLVLEWLPGEAYDPDADRERRRARLHETGRLLARLHRATAGWFDAHGPLEPGGGFPAVTAGRDWPDRLAAFVDDWATDLAGTPDADVASAVVEFVGEHRHAFAGRRPVVVHGEPCPEHVRYDGRDAVGLLDWELAQAAPGEFDLVWAERDFLRTPLGVDVDDDFRAALHRGYEAVRPLPGGSTVRCEAYRAAFAMRDLSLVARTGADDDRREPLRAYVFDRLSAAEWAGPG